MIDSDLKRAAFILFHSLLSQFDSVSLKWGKFLVHGTAHSLLQDFCNCMYVRMPAVLSFPVFLFDGVMALNNLSCACPVCVLQDRGIGNTSLSTFGVAQAALEIILMLYPFSDPSSQSACSTAKSNTVRPALFTQDIAQPDIFQKTMYNFVTSSLKRCRLSEAAVVLCCCSLIDLLNSYLMVSSVVGFYSLRVFEVLTPRKDDTTMTTVRTDGVRGEVAAEIPPEVLCVWDPLRFTYFLLFSLLCLPPSSPF